MLRRPSGTISTEYVLILVIIAAVLWTLLKDIFQSTSGKYDDIGSQL